MSRSIIVAAGENDVIGNQGDLPWRLPADLKRFKKLTMGHAIIMGRRTFETLPKPLPGRRNVVVTRQSDYAREGVEVVASPQAALELTQNDSEAFIAGGGEIYSALMPHADRMYLTRVHGVFEGDAHFPPWDRSQWRLLSSERHEADERHDWPYTFLVYQRAP